MEQFVFHDIFDTKGIEYIIVISFFLVLIPFWYLLNRPLKAAGLTGGKLKPLSLENLRIPGGLFFNRNHTWSHLETSGVASVGMDDLLLHLTGGVEISYLKQQQDRVKRGEPIARIMQDGKQLVITSPLTGVVEKVHASLDRQDAGGDPYRDWLYRIRPADWKEETLDAMLAEEASEWTSGELERVKDYMASRLNQGEPVLQEGGELMPAPLRELDDTAWKDFQEQFLGPEA